jgi:hypothetical protein
MGKRVQSLVLSSRTVKQTPGRNGRIGTRGSYVRPPDRR